MEMSKEFGLWFLHDDTMINGQTFPAGTRLHYWIEAVDAQGVRVKRWPDGDGIPDTPGQAFEIRTTAAQMGLAPGRYTLYVVAHAIYPDGQRDTSIRSNGSPFAFTRADRPRFALSWARLTAWIRATFGPSGSST